MPKELSDTVHLLVDHWKRYLTYCGIDACKRGAEHRMIPDDLAAAKTASSGIDHRTNASSGLPSD